MNERQARAWLGAALAAEIRLHVCVMLFPDDRWEYSEAYWGKRSPASCDHEPNEPACDYCGHEPEP